jgi:ubiquinone/menaquinone biosynthesis C-methylase UbiE|tara:strand:- start:324 stop:1244 length:921 start_codon:yes stop_codon:yes gene_type:complete
MEFLTKKYKNVLIENQKIAVVGDKTLTTEKVTEFYKDAPFPNYNDFQSKSDLLQIINSNPFVKDLKDKIGFNKKFIEVGSGTSQLSLALASGTNNEIVALDPTLESLKLGAEFAAQNNINNVKFLNADIFNNPIKNDYFDFVWCSGVLHHTQNSEEGFNIIYNWLKPGGTIIIGLYNSYGRLRTNIRQFIYKTLGKGNLSRNLILKLDPYLRQVMSDAKREAWIRDQYEHPVERSHTLGEVLKWFKNKDVNFIGSIPSPTLETSYQPIDYMDGEKGTPTSRVLSQINMLFSNSGKEGGLFIVIGKK